MELGVPGGFIWSMVTERMVSPKTEPYFDIVYVCVYTNRYEEAISCLGRRNL